MSKTLVVGSKGSMGRRFIAVLRYLQQDYLEADLGDPWWEWDFDRVILATPTNRHVEDLDLAIFKGKPILCEKPIALSSDAVSVLAQKARNAGVDVRMCCNWLYAISLALRRSKGPKGQEGAIAVMGEMSMAYDYYNSGKDGFFWDCIQLLYMAGRFKYSRRSPAMDLTVDGYEVSLGHVEESYVMMVSQWIHGDKEKLWSLEDALKASQKVEWALSQGYSQEAGEIDFRLMRSPFYDRAYIGEDADPVADRPEILP
jgi:hypothetical protein